MRELTPEPKPEGDEGQSENVLPGSYAWRRYFARTVDNAIVMSLISLILLTASMVVMIVVDRPAGMAYAEWMSNRGWFSNFLFALGNFLLWLPIEALFLSAVGVTPGKWVFGIQVRTEAGKLPGYWTAFSRAARALFKGLALGIPLVSLITLFVSYDHLVTKGSMSWDDELKTKVEYQKLTNLRLALCVVVVIIWAVLSLWGTVRLITKM